MHTVFFPTVSSLRRGIAVAVEYVLEVVLVIGSGLGRHGMKFASTLGYDRLRRKLISKCMVGAVTAAVR